MIAGDSKWWRKQRQITRFWKQGHLLVGGLKFGELEKEDEPRERKREMGKNEIKKRKIKNLFFVVTYVT